MTDELAELRAENERLRRLIADFHADAVKQIKGTADDMAAAGERMLKSFRAEMQSRVIDPLFAERDTLAACRAAVEALCDEAEDPNRWPPRGVTFDGAPFPALVPVDAVRAALATPSPRVGA